MRKLLSLSVKQVSGMQLLAVAVVLAMYPSAKNTDLSHTADHVVARDLPSYKRLTLR